MNLLRITLLTIVTLLALARPAHCAWTNDFPLGYDADHKFYFHRTNSFDNSLQVAIDAGWASYGTSLSQPENYRNVNNFDPSTRQLMLGVMGEKIFFNAYCSVSAGLSYMMLSTYMFGWPMSRGSDAIISTENSSVVNYTTISNVSTTTSYISIPIEAKYELVCNEKFGIYLKGALRTSINLGTRTDLDMQPNTSTEIKKQAEAFFKNGNSIFVNANAYLGFRFGSYDESNFRLELGLPFPLTSNVANVSTKMGFGFRVSYSVPLSLFSR